MKTAKETFIELHEKAQEAFETANTMFISMNKLSILNGYTKIEVDTTHIFIRGACPICGCATDKGPEIILTWQGEQICRECMKELASTLTEKVDYIFNNIRIPDEYFSNAEYYESLAEEVNKLKEEV